MTAPPAGSPLAAVAVGTGGAVGALLRHAVSTRIDAGPIPAGTFAVNVFGTFALGLLTALGPGGTLALFFGVGLCGAFTTFSSFAVETVGLWADGRRARAVGNAAGTLAAAGLALAAAWRVAALVG